MRVKRPRSVCVLDTPPNCFTLELGLRYEDIDARKIAQAQGFTWNAVKKVWHKVYPKNGDGTQGRILTEQVGYWNATVKNLDANPPAPVPYVKKDVVDATRVRVSALEQEVNRLTSQLSDAVRMRQEMEQKMLQNTREQVLVGKCPGCGEEVYIKSTDLKEVTV